MDRDAEAILVRWGPESADSFTKCIEIAGEFPGLPGTLCNCEDHANNKPTTAAARYIGPGGAKGLSVEEFDRRVGIREGRANDEGRLKRGWM